jgi:hypothetical protein
MEVWIFILIWIALSLPVSILFGKIIAGPR